MCPQGACLADKAAQVFTVGIDCFLDTRLLDGDVQGVGGRDTLDGSACPALVEGAVVVVSQFDDDPVTRTYALLHVSPEAVVEGTAGGASQGMVLHRDA